MVRLALALSHTVCKLDIKDSSSGTASRQRHLDQGLREVLNEVITSAPYDSTGWFRRFDGDSATVAFPASVPKAWIAAELTRQLELALLGFNEHLDRLHRLRLRMALDHGDVMIDEPNIAGEPVTVTARLSESTDLRNALRVAPETNLALIVSERFFDEVIRQKTLGLDPADFRHVAVEVRHFSGHGWLRKVHRPHGSDLAEGEPAPSAPDPDRGPGGGRPGAAAGNTYLDVSAGYVGQLGGHIYNYGK